MSNWGGEKMSRLSVGLFALALTGGLAAFFSGLLDSYFVDNQPSAPPPVAMPFAKPKPATPSSAASAPVSATTPATASAAPTESVAAKQPTTPNQVKAAVAIPAEVESPPVSTLDERVPVVTPETALVAKPAVPKITQTTRKRDLDMRSCLDLPTEMEIAQCAYKLQ